MAYVSEEEVIEAFFKALYPTCPVGSEVGLITIKTEVKYRQKDGAEYLTATIYDGTDIVLQWIYAKLGYKGELMLLRASILEQAKKCLDVLSKPWGYKYNTQRQLILETAQELQ